MNRAHCNKILPEATSHIHRLLFVFTFTLTFFLASCASTTKNISSDEVLAQKAIESNQSLVFGNILWVENGQQKTISTSIFGFYIKPSLLRLEDKARILCDVGENGDFIWALEPGTYVINKMEYRDTWSGNYFFVPKVAFRISEAERTHYIGQLDVNFETKRDLIGGLSGQAEFSINDHSPTVYEKFSKENGIPKDDIGKALMVHDTRLPSTFDTTVEFNIGLQLINAILATM